MARTEFKKDKKGEWRWHVKDDNNEIVAQGEGYTREDDAHDGFGNAVRAMVDAALTPALFESEDGHV